MRLFIAVPLPSELARQAASALPAQRGLRPVSPELMHLTLAFLGATSASRLADVRAAVRDGVAGEPRFAATLDRIGRFPERGDPRVVWLGIGAGAEQLASLAARVRGALRARGIAFDDKAFRAHVTLARVRDELAREDRRAIAHAVEASTPPRGSFAVDEVVVFESVVSSKGARYTARVTAPLAAEAS